MQASLRARVLSLLLVCVSSVADSLHLLSYSGGLDILHIHGMCGCMCVCTRGCMYKAGADCRKNKLRLLQQEKSERSIERSAHLEQLSAS